MKRSHFAGRLRVSTGHFARRLTRLTVIAGWLTVIRVIRSGHIRRSAGVRLTRLTKLTVIPFSTYACVMRAHMRSPAHARPKGGKVPSTTVNTVNPPPLTCGFTVSVGENHRQPGRKVPSTVNRAAGESARTRFDLPRPLRTVATRRPDGRSVTVSGHSRPRPGGDRPVESETRRSPMMSTEFAECPMDDCVYAAVVTDRYSLESTHGPVEHVVARCLAGHIYNGPVPTKPGRKPRSR